MAVDTKAVVEEKGHSLTDLVRAKVSKKKIRYQVSGWPGSRCRRSALRGSS